MHTKGEKFGEIRFGKEIDYRKSESNQRYVWGKCPKCSDGKWTNVDVGNQDDGITSKSICKRCCGSSGKPRTPYKKNKIKSGYVHIAVPKIDPLFPVCHQKNSRSGIANEHRYVMSQHLGRPLYKWESVHHKNGKRDDNRIENLELWTTPQRAGQRVRDLIVDYLDEMSKEEAEQVFKSCKHFRES
jgi:hypothetical protein